MRGTARDAKGGGRVVHGQVSSSGAIVSGTGFSVTRTGAGIYVITFLPAFPAVPDVVANAVGAIAFPDLSPSGPGSIQFDFFNVSSVHSDTAFHFTATEEPTR